MGVVFEAEDLETGRRVALKILGQALDSPEARKRFLREGQIAASINHPNSVYVFGTEEIAGTPIIAMELVGGGTLRDRVMASGPFPAVEAVDVLIQLIAGLESAQQAGVLHRDIKPSNCFLDADGTVKIGDFGLSITTAVRTESNLTGATSLFGTPAFSSPEQLRGEELSVRSDIYSVGVTMYYLLTGRMPFEAPNIVQLLVTVLEKQPQSPARLQAGIPEGLARAVLRCLQKDPAARFESYVALRRALQPYASFSPTPATLALRFGAWGIDQVILSVPIWAIFFLIFGSFSAMASLAKGPQLLASAFAFLLVVAYFGWFEGLRGASPGKALCRLRVAGFDGNTPGLGRGLLRATLFCVVSSLPAMGLVFLNSDWMLHHPKASIAWLIPTACQLLLFCTCRRQNGFAALHDTWSRTRVLARSAQPIRPILPPMSESPMATGELAQIGPYHVLAELGRSGEACILLGYDARLLRKVWLRRVPPATPPVAAALRHLARPGRLRWINGRRSDDAGWDAYEASAGQPLLNLVATRQDWEQVRFWLLDLAAELKASEKDRSLPLVLSLDRIWITADGHAKLLDFPAPGIHPVGVIESPQGLSPIEFLQQAALSALAGRPLSGTESRVSLLDLPLPLYVRGFFQRLEAKPDAGQICAQLKSLVGKVAAITRRRRSALLALAIGFPILMSVVPLLGGFFLMKRPGNLEMFALQSCLLQCQPLESVGTNAPSQPPEVGKKRQQFENYIAGRFRPLITNSVEWNGVMARAYILPEQKALAQRIIATHPTPTPDEFTEAKTAIESQFHIIPPAAAQDKSPFLELAFIVPLILYAGTLIFVVLPCFAAALLFRGGLAMRLLGLAVVGRNGMPSRPRTLRRNFIAWLPFLCSPMLVKVATEIAGANWAVPIAAGLLILVTLLSLGLRRSLQDRLAQTWLVPDGALADMEPVAGDKSQTRFPWLPMAAGAGVLILLIALGLFSAHFLATRKPSLNTAAIPIPDRLVAKPCVALLPDGTPAADARVWVGTEKDPSLSCFQPGDYYPRGLQKIQVDAAGRFNLPAVPDDTLVIVTHPAGILVTTAAPARQASPIRLQPFGQVEGRLLSEGKPKPGAQICIDLLQNQSGLALNRSAVTGADGRFQLTNLVAGEYRLYRMFLPRRRQEGGFAVHPSHQKIVSVKPGETVSLQWGGDGRSVVGQALPENPAVTVDWLSGSYSLELMLASPATGLAKFVRESYGLATSSAQQLKAARAERSYHLEFGENGSFRAEDVPPGEYELRIRVTKPAALSRDHLQLEGEVLGALVQSVTIPTGTEPYDLGTRIVPIKGEPADALAPPLTANLTTIEGKSLSLASLRGKYVVLVLEASWSLASQKTLAALQPLRAGFTSEAGVEFVAASLDDDASSLRQAAARKDYGFTMTLFAMNERVSAIEAFAVTTLPAVILLGPDGRLIARDLAAERLQAILVDKIKPAHSVAKLALEPEDPMAGPPDWRVAGVVIGDDGQAVVGATIQPQGASFGNGSQQWGGFVNESVVTDTQGRFLLQWKSKIDLIYAMVSARGAAPRPVQLQLGRDYVLRLHEGVLVTGRLVAGSHPVSGAQFRVLPVNRPNGEFFESDKFATDGDGRFSIPNLPPEKELVLLATMDSLQGQGTLSAKSFTTGKNRTTTDLGDLKLQPGFLVSGQIVLTNGEPAPAQTRLLLARGGDYAEATLDDHGRFQFLSVPAESVCLSARLKGYKFTRSNPSLDWLNDQIIGTVDRDITNLTLVMEPGEFHYSSNHEDVPEGTDLQPRDKPLRGVRPF
jgi:uncharacterized RDD family membrane protein YckC